MKESTKFIQRSFGLNPLDIFPTALIVIATILASFCLTPSETSGQVISMQANGSGGTTMALCNSGYVQMWGNNGVGQEGTNFAASSGNSFVLVLAGADAGCPTYLCSIKSVAAGSNYDSYALDSTGHVWSWGECQFAELGNGSDGVVGCTQGTPVEVGTAASTPLSGITTIAAGFNTAFAIDASGNLWGWGFNSSYGYVGNNSSSDVPYAVQVHGVNNVGFLTGITACATGGASLAVGAGGAVYGWGLNNCGQCGSGYPTNYLYPVNVKTSGSTNLTNCIAVAAGNETSYALDNSGHVWTWGIDNLGQGGVNKTDNAPGDGGGSSNNYAVEVGSNCGGGVLNNITAIAAGWTNAYALDNTGHVWAWGYNANGECGIGNQTEQDCPVEVETGPGTPLTNIISIAGSTWEAMALSSTGVIYTWGYNSGGQLGNGTGISSDCLYATGMTAGYCSIDAVIPLPVELINFDAEYNPASMVVDMNWSTASEINNNFFTVERASPTPSEGSELQFIPIGKVQGAGNSTSMLTYNFTDTSPLSFGKGSGDGTILYYRLKQTDFDGKYQYSRIVTVSVQSNYKLEILSLNYNATENGMQYFISYSSGKPFYIEITDRMGRIVFSKISEENIGTINCSEFAHSIYLFRAFDGNVSSVRKFVY